MKKLVLAMTAVVSAACGGPKDNCGVGTKNIDGYCAVDYTQIQTATCGTDTALQGTTCISVLSCGNGASRMGNQCVAAPAGTSCGSGTELQGNVCVATGSGSLTCGAGTARQGSQCVATGAQVTCGTGTALMSNQCVVDLGSVCSTDTTGAGGNRCVSTLSCGSGTTRQGSQCVSSGSASCGPGTMLSNGQCVPVSATGPLSTFIQQPNLAAGAYLPSSSYPHRLVVTELTQGNADAWAGSGANMIGTGRALHVSNYAYWSVTTTPTFLTIVDSTSSGSCSATASTTASPSGGSQAYVNFFSWSNGTATRVACGTQGSVKVERAVNPATMTTQTKATINGYFSDGTTLTDKIVWFP